MLDAARRESAGRSGAAVLEGLFLYLRATMNIERLFNVLVLGGASLGLAACGGGSAGGGASEAASGTGAHGGEAATGGSAGQGGNATEATAGSGGGAASGTGGGGDGPQCTKAEFPGHPYDPCGCPCCWVNDCRNDEPCCADFCSNANNGMGCCGD